MVGETGRDLYILIRVYGGRQLGCVCALAHRPLMYFRVPRVEESVFFIPWGRGRLSQYTVPPYDSVTVRGLYPTPGPSDS